MRKCHVAAVIFCALLALLAPGSAEEDQLVEISPELERAIRFNLEYLSRLQNPDGSWNDGGFKKNVGANSLILMAFMSLGNLPGEGAYGATVARGVDFILSQARPSGLIQCDDSQGAVMYGHALSTLMLSEVWGQSPRKDVGSVLRRAVDLILRVQGSKGGWNYRSVPQDGDTSVCVMQMFALQSAFEAGMQIPRATVEKAMSLIKTRYDEKIRGFGYANNQYNVMHIGSSAAGTCIMQICGEKDPRFTLQTLEPLTEALRSGNYLQASMRYYYFYYSSVANFKAGGEHYRQWMALLEPVLLKDFAKQGHWGDPGSLHDTAFCVLAAALPYRYIPIYQN